MPAAGADARQRDGVRPDAEFASRCCDDASSAPRFRICSRRGRRARRRRHRRCRPPSPGRARWCASRNRASAPLGASWRRCRGDRSPGTGCRCRCRASFSRRYSSTVVAAMLTLTRRMSPSRPRPIDRLHASSTYSIGHCYRILARFHGIGACARASRALSFRCGFRPWSAGCGSSCPCAVAAIVQLLMQ